MCVWRADRSISANSARQYLQWIGQFRRYCSERGLVEVDELTRDGAKRSKVEGASLPGRIPPLG
jgi:integrase/recombinase XerD